MNFALALLALLSPQANACSCASVSSPTSPECFSSTRAFTGTVGAFAWPPVLGVIGRTVEIELEVDGVWAGAVPPRVTAVTGLGGGDCGLHPTPGTRFVVCDDRHAAQAPALGACRSPAFDGHAVALAQTLGPSDPPVPGSSLWSTVLQRGRWLAGPALVLVVVGLAMATGAVVRRARGDRFDGLHLRWARLAAVAMGGAVVIRMLVSNTESLPLAALGPALVGVGLASVVAYAAGRGSEVFVGRVRGFATAMSCAVVVVVVGHLPLHAPVQPVGAVECSKDRARRLLMSLEPQAVDAAGVHELIAQQRPRACTDWGLARFSEARWGMSACLTFPDGAGGVWAACRSDGEVHFRYGWEGL